MSLTPTRRLYALGAIILVTLTICSRNFGRMGELSFLIHAICSQERFNYPTLHSFHFAQEDPP